MASSPPPVSITIVAYAATKTGPSPDFAAANLARPHHASPHVAKDSQAKRRDSGKFSDSGVALLKSAVLGATCVGFPAACPAIMMLSKADEMIQLARRILQALYAQESPTESAETAGLFLSKTIVKSCAEAGANAALDPVIGRVAVLVATEVSAAVPNTTRFALPIVEGTVSGLARGGIDGVLSYGLRDS